MNPEAGSYFDSIESAHNFVDLLAGTVSEVKQEIDADIAKESGSPSSRRLAAFRLASYNLEKLAVHMKATCRILNDLRSLRRLLFGERTAAPAVSSKAPEITESNAKPPEITQSDVPPAPVRPTATDVVTRPATKALVLRRTKPASVAPPAPNRGRATAA